LGEQIEDLIGTFGNLIEKAKKSLPQKFVQNFQQKNPTTLLFFFFTNWQNFAPAKHTHIGPNVTKSFSEIRGFLSKKLENFDGTFPFKILIVLMLTKFQTKKNNKLCD